jgi:hypothetical protein
VIALPGRASGTARTWEEKESGRRGAGKPRRLSMVVSDCVVLRTKGGTGMAWAVGREFVVGTGAELSLRRKQAVAAIVKIVSRTGLHDEHVQG